MDDQRRYGERDIRTIFERAGLPAGDYQRTISSTNGLTLAELQSIGSEIGFSHQQIADAAASLTFPAERRNVFGMPIGLTRIASLPRLPDDQAWELLLVELRAAFGVQGKDSSKGNLREWTNGTLLACIEPSTNGCQIRLRSSKPEAVLVNGIGVAWLLGGLITLVTLVSSGDLVGGNAYLPVICGAIGTATLVYNGFWLRRWARECGAQMHHVIERARTLLTGASTLDASREP